MALETIRDYQPLSACTAHVWPLKSCALVGIGFGALFQLMQPDEARELAAALTAAADAACPPLPIADVAEVG